MSDQLPKTRARTKGDGRDGGGGGGGVGGGGVWNETGIKTNALKTKTNEPNGRQKISTNTQCKR